MELSTKQVLIPVESLGMKYDLSRQDKAPGMVSDTWHEYEKQLKYASADLLRYRTKRWKKVEAKKKAKDTLLEEHLECQHFKKNRSF